MKNVNWSIKEWEQLEDIQYAFILAWWACRTLSFLFNSSVISSSYFLFHQVHMRVHHLWFIFQKKIWSHYLTLFLLLDATEHFMRVLILTAFPESLLFHFFLSLGLCYCCWQTGFHTYPSPSLWGSLSLPHWNWGNMSTLRGSDSLLVHLTVGSPMIYLHTVCVDEFSVRYEIAKVTLNFGMVSSSWSIVLMRYSTLDTLVQLFHIQNIKKTLSLCFLALSTLSLVLQEMPRCWFGHTKSPSWHN